MILPTSEKTFVPLLPSVPTEANAFAPFAMMYGTFAQVSTLLSVVGLPWRPTSTVWTYFARGSPSLPSSEAISAVDSPQTNAPPPRLMRMSKENPEPRMSSPSSPYRRASSIAWRSRTTASGYSLRT